MRGFGAISAFLLAGCAQLLGLAETSTGTDGGSVDASPTSVTMQIQRDSIGTTAARSAYDVTPYPANFLVADSSAAGFHRVVATAAADTWSAEIPDGAPPMEITLGLDLPDVFRRLYILPQRNVKVLYGLYEQPGAPPAPAAGTISATITLPAPSTAAEEYQLYSVGSWANHGFVPATDYVVGGTSISVAAIPYNVTTWGNISGRPFTKITSADEMLALRYSGAQLTGAAEFAPFDQSDTNSTISATMTAVAAAPMDVHISPTNVDSRLAGPTPKNAALAMSWSLNASPGWEIANGAGPQLQAGSMLVTDTGALALPFGNPFAAKGWQSTFSFSSNKSRTFAIPGLMNLVGTFYTGLSEVATLAPGLTIDTPAGVPNLVSINQMPLSTDGMTITIDPTKSVTLSLVADKTDPTYYQFNIYELRLNAALTALEVHVAYVAVSATTSATVPNDVFVAGKTYFVRGYTLKGGFPSFATGNFWDRNLPYCVGFLDAGVFTVAAP
jgi:hypothetical protein